MGQTLSSPVTEKHSDDGSNEKYIFGSSCMQGWRVSMEDAHTTILSLESDAEAAFFAVFDGHGGQAAAKFSGLHLADRIAKDASYAKAEYQKAIKAGFLGLDYDLKTDADFLDDVSGCTAVCALFTNDKRIFVGNAGDSRIVLSVDGKVKELSFDHKPQNPDEYARIYQAGGFVEYGRVNGNLALSRAIGDFEFKQNMRLPAEEQAVTANPDITEHSITEEDEFIILACDGIWDCMSSQEAVTFVRKLLAQGIDLAQICEKLMDHCLAPASDYGGLGCDNMTVVIVAILNGKTPSEWTEMMASRVAVTKEEVEEIAVQNSGSENEANSDLDLSYSEDQLKELMARSSETPSDEDANEAVESENKASNDVKEPQSDSSEEVDSQKDVKA